MNNDHRTQTAIAAMPTFSAGSLRLVPPQALFQAMLARHAGTPAKAHGAANDIAPRDRAA
ncbi:MAG: hypothetical protein U1E56_01070 [Bauldia sp.]